MSAKEIIKAFPDPKGGILNIIDKEACEKAVGQILEGGDKTLRELVGLILEPGKGNDVQARHALHATAIRVGGPEKKKLGSRWSIGTLHWKLCAWKLRRS